MNNIVFVVIADVYRKTVLYDNIKRYVINFWTILLAVLLIGFFYSYVVVKYYSLRMFK